jgi:DNA-binding transcriptional regulator YiaG
MTKCGNCGGGSIKKLLIPSYDADLLGAPFSVVLENSVWAEVCEKCESKVATIIPDLDDLVRSVAMCRAMMPRKLSGKEIKFLRTSVGCKAKEVAAKLDLAPEHLSRCENDVKPLGPLAERWFRLFIIVKATDRLRKKAVDFVAVKKHMSITTLVDMKIETTWDPNVSLVLRLVHRKTAPEPDLFDTETGEWEPEDQPKAA